MCFRLHRTLYVIVHPLFFNKRHTNALYPLCSPVLSLEESTTMKQSYHVESSPNALFHHILTVYHLSDDPPSGWRGHFICVSSFTSSFAEKKFSSFSFPNILPWAWNTNAKTVSILQGYKRAKGYKLNNILVIIMYDSVILGLYCITLNWASGGPVMMTILWVTSGLSAGAIWTCIYTH